MGRTHCTFSINKATDTHLEYVRIIAFPRLQLLQKNVPPYYVCNFNASLFGNNSDLFRFIYVYFT